MTEVEDAVQTTLEQNHDPKLNAAVAALVAITATLMAVGNIKDGNIVQAMTMAQAKSVDAWSYYQAKSTKEVLARNMVELLRFQKAPAATVARYQSEAARYGKEKDDVKAQAEGYDKEYDRLNTHDDQFDMSEACFTVALALYGIAALTRKRWLLGMAIFLSSLGLLLEISGFLGGAFHPDWLARLLG